jgi:UDP-N-acetylmuramoyl-tripeptide--D-alanyl-D-alanine ligase
MPADRLFILDDAKAAVEVLEKIIEPSDVILVKGSRGAHLDMIVAELGQD